MCFSYLIPYLERRQSRFSSSLSRSCLVWMSESNHMKASHISYSSLIIVFYGYLVCFVFHMNKNKPNQKHVFIKGALRVTVNFLFKPSYQYSQTDRIFSYLTISVAFASFNTLRFFPRDRSFSRSLIPNLHFLAHFSISFLPHFLCVQKWGCLDLHPFSPAFSLSFSPLSPLSLALPLTFSHFLSPSLIPTLQLSLSFLPPPFPLSFSPSLFAELIWTFSQSCSCLQHDPDQSGPDWIWRPRQHFWALKWQFWDAASISSSNVPLSHLIHFSNYTFLYF